MQQYFVNYKSNDTERFQIKEEDYHHIARVMRMKEGDEIICVTTDKKSALCEIAEISNDSVSVKVLSWQENSNELPIEITIVSGIPKGDKLELVVQKGTELGAVKFLPYEAVRSVSKWDGKKSIKKIERLQKIVKEAAEQSFRQQIPTVAEPVSLDELILLSESYDYKLVAYEEEAKHGEKSTLASIFKNAKAGEKLLCVFGPEGGLTEDEVAQLKSKGFLICGLGPRILRTETAPFYLLSAASYELELNRN